MGQAAANLCVCKICVYFALFVFFFCIYNSAVSGCFVLLGKLNFAIMCTTNNAVLQYLLAAKSQSIGYADVIII